MKLHPNCFTSNLVIPIFIFAGSALGVALPPFSTATAELHEKRDNACGFVGNSELYGLGIRLGVYFQWISAFIASIWHQERRQDLANAYLIFAFALVVAMIVATLQTQPAYTAEILLLTYIIFGGTIVVLTASNLPQRVYSKGAQNISFVSVTFWASMIIYCAAGVYCSWFWLYGYRYGFLETPCGTFGFLFTRVSLYNPPIAKFFAALSIYTGISYGCILLGGLAISILLLLKVPKVVKWIKDLRPKTHKKPLRWKGWQKRFVFITLATIFVIIIYSMVGIELTIYWNSISGVYTINTTGQLIPFIIGLLGLLSILYKPFLLWCKKRWPSSKSERGDDSESVQESSSLEDEAYEAREANRRLGYLDLERSVDRLIIHKWRREGLMQRNEQT